MTVEGFADPFLLLFELRLVGHLLPAAAAAGAGMSATGFDTVGRWGDDFEKATLFGETSFTGKLKKNFVAGDHVGDFSVVGYAVAL